jgi:hypothetical protein
MSLQAFMSSNSKDGDGFMETARLVAGESPPSWLAKHLQRWSSSVMLDGNVHAKQFGKAEARARLQKLSEAAESVGRELHDTVVVTPLLAGDFGPLTQVPVVFLDHLTDVQAKALRLADNKLTDRSSWDDGKVAAQLKELSELVLDFDIEAIGFELPEIDIRIQSLDASDVIDNADEFDAATGSAVSIAGDLWLLGPNRLYCGNAL